MRITMPGGILFILTMLVLSHGSSSANGMAMPFMPAREVPRDVRWSAPRNAALSLYDPTDVRVYTPSQHAVILFNGHEEILCLSTQMHASETTAVLEVVAFPSKPEVSVGIAESMAAMEALMRETASQSAATEGNAEKDIFEQGARLSYRKRIGAHDIAVVEVLDIAHFRSWVEAYFDSHEAVNPSIRETYIDIVSDYLARDFTWFVFDTVYLTGFMQCREPVEYRFETDHLYYPMLTSTRQAGDTAIDFLVVTPARMDIEWPRRPHLQSIKAAEISRPDLHRISLSWANFVGRRDIRIDHYHLSGGLYEFDEDLVALPATAR